jgi:hypothetical protein
MELKSRYVHGKLKVIFIIDDRNNERYRTLLGELESGFPEFKDFAQWKRSLTVFIGHCQEICREIWQRVEKETGLPMESPFIVGIGASKGRLYDVPRFIYEFALSHYLMNEVPQLQVLATDLSSRFYKCKLIVQNDRQHTLAEGSEGEMSKCQEAAISLCKQYGCDDRIGKIITEQVSVREQALHFQSALAKILAGTV